MQCRLGALPTWLLKPFVGGVKPAPNKRLKLAGGGGRIPFVTNQARRRSSSAIRFRRLAAMKSSHFKIPTALVIGALYLGAPVHRRAQGARATGALPGL